jgi:DNA polymerase
MGKAELLQQLKQDCIDCRKCSIGGCVYDDCSGNVFSNMCMKARIMVVGQNPGAVEVKKGTPFIGPSGAFFDKAIKEVLGLDRSHLYISNTVRCFTPGNRPPSRQEVENCMPFLEREIKIVKPVLVLTLGNHALFQLTGRNGIMKVHGQCLRSLKYEVIVLPLLHPSPLNMNKPDKKKLFYDDLKKLGEYV